MTKHRDARYIAAPCEKVFALVADVERYPEFLPLWKSACIFARQPDGYCTEQEIGVGPIRERFRTRTVLSPPQRIDVTSDDALFRAFHISWQFAPVRNGCRATIWLNWEMRSRPLQKAIDLLLPSVARSMVDSFESRAMQTLV